MTVNRYTLTRAAVFDLLRRIIANAEARQPSLEREHQLQMLYRLYYELSESPIQEPDK